MVAPAEHFSPIGLPGAKEASEEIPAPRGMPNTMVSGEIIVDDKKLDTEQSADTKIRKRIFECVGRLNSVHSYGFVGRLQKLIKENPTDKDLLVALETEMEVRGRVGVCLSP